MSKVAFSIFVYSFYLFLMGIGMMLIPNILLGLFGFLPTTEIWIRVLGLFTCTTGIYYFYCAKNEQKAFFDATIVGRLFFFVVLTILTFVFQQSFMLALIGSVDLLGAIWTLTVRKE